MHMIADNLAIICEDMPHPRAASGAAERILARSRVIHVVTVLRRLLRQRCWLGAGGDEEAEHGVHAGEVGVVRCTVPVSGLIKPSSSFKRVVLPAPFGPMQAVILSAGIIAWGIFKIVRPLLLTVISFSSTNLSNCSVILAIATLHYLTNNKGKKVRKQNNSK